MDAASPLLDTQDIIALLVFFISWFSYTHFSENHHRSRSLNGLINHYRKCWMQQMFKRDNRSVDAIMIGNLSRSFTFFASTTIFILAALVSMLSYHEKMSVIFNSIPFATGNSQLAWELKIFLMISIFIYSFFKFTWSMRLYNYVSIFVAAMPLHDERKDEHEALAVKGAKLLSNAGRHFNNGLRAYYFGLAVLAWFVHPYLFIATTILVVGVTYRREYLSNALKHLGDS
jgi:uncharacterized membrane protein